jgi:peptide-methionine (R)-S-oxide reductase
MEKIEKTDEQWRAELDPDAYAVLRRQATEPPFTGKYTFEKASGTFKCAGCDAEIFRSDDKYDSGCGWPSFTHAAHPDAVELRPDNTHGMIRTEVVCARCGGHLGHVFDDGPAEAGGQRYCINSVALELQVGGTDS